jgi:hypothetical protein
MEKKIFTLLAVIFAITMSANAQISLGNFEDGGITPAYKNESGDDAVSTVSIAVNPDKGGVNKTDKTLLAETSADKFDAWWGGPRVDFNSAFTVNSSNTYLHILVKTDLPKYEFLVLFDASSEAWNGTFNPTTTDWFDYVIDLTDVKGVDDLSGKSVTGFRVAVSVNDDGQQGKKLYLDEIIVNDDPTPRSTGTGINNLSTQKGAIYATSTGIAIKEMTGAVTIYDLTGRSVYKNTSTGNLTVPLTSGLYIVSVNGVKQKALVK